MKNSQKKKKEHISNTKINEEESSINFTPMLLDKNLSEYERLNYKNIFYKWLNENTPQWDNYILHSYCSNCNQNIDIIYNIKLTCIYIISKDGVRLCAIPKGGKALCAIKCTKCYNIETILSISGSYNSPRKSIKETLRTSSDKLKTSFGLSSSSSLSEE